MDEAPRIQIRRLVTLGFILLIFGLVAWFGFRYFFGLKRVTLIPEQGTTITLTQSGTNYPASTKEIVRTQEKTTVRVSKGYYNAVFSGDAYKTESKQLNITSKTTVQTPELSYSDSRLQEMLVPQKSAIESTIRAGFDDISKYNISDGKLYLRGDWYAGKLLPIDPEQDDVLLVVLKKSGNTWSIAAGPTIVLYIKEFPKVPEPVIRNINNR